MLVRTPMTKNPFRVEKPTSQGPPRPCAAAERGSQATARARPFGPPSPRPAPPMNAAARDAGREGFAGEAAW
jgi:hypothetical protein